MVKKLILGKIPSDRPLLAWKINKDGEIEEAIAFPTKEELKEKKKGGFIQWIKNLFVS